MGGLWDTDHGGACNSQNHRSRWNWRPEILPTDPVLKSIDVVDSLVNDDCNPDRHILKKCNDSALKKLTLDPVSFLEDVRLETKRSNKEQLVSK
jgi:hypothetical protein